MSLILDALRKSERTRQQTLTGQVSTADIAAARPRIPVPWATLIGLLLVTNAIVLAIIVWRTPANRSVSSAVATRIPVKTSSAVALAPAYHPEVRSLAAEAAGISATGTAATAAGPPAALAANSVATALTATPAATPSSALGTAVSTPLSSPITGASVDGAPPLDSLPLAFQQSLPPLHLDVHSYSADPAHRFVVINMQRYQAGDTLKEGPKVVRIVPDGVVLEYHGQEFLLPRP